MGINKGKFYDARKTAAYFNKMKQSAKYYETRSKAVDNAYNFFAANGSYTGGLAATSKIFVKDGLGKILHETVNIHEYMTKIQDAVIEAFETMVDPALNARIEYDTLDLIDGDFKGYYNEYCDVAGEVKKTVDKIINEFSNYDSFEQPDSETAKNSFEVFCGGKVENAGYIKACQDKFVTFDSEVKAKLLTVDIPEHTDNISTRIQKAEPSLFSITAGKTSMPTSSIMLLLMNGLKVVKECVSKFQESTNGVFGKPNWYGNPMQLDGSSEQEQLLASRLAKMSKVSWNQEKVDQLWGACENIYDQYGIQVDPRMLLAIIIQEGTGSFNTNADEPAADGQHGTETNYALDLMKANNLVFGKILGYMYYHDEFEQAIASSSANTNLNGQGGVFDYINWYTPIVNLNKEQVYPGVYAGDSSWGDKVENLYEGLTHEGAGEEYSQYILSIDRSQLDEIIGDINMIDYTFLPNQDGQDCLGNLNGTWTINAN